MRSFHCDFLLSISDRKFQFLIEKIPSLFFLGVTMKMTKRLGNAVHGASTFSSWSSHRFCFSLPSSWPSSGSSTTNKATAWKTRVSCSTSIQLSWLVATLRFRASVSFKREIFRFATITYWRYSSCSSLPHLSMLLASYREIVSRVFPCLFHSMHCHRLFGRLGVEKRKQHTSLLLVTLLAWTHHVGSFCFPVCLRLL